MRLKVIIILAVLMFSTLSAKAEEKKEISFHAGFFTYHFDSERANNHNRLLAFSYDGWTIAEFENSYYKETVFLGYEFITKKYALNNSRWFARGGVYCGAVYGYGEKLPLHWEGVSPFLLPVGEIGYRQVSLEIGVIPLPGSAGLVTGMLKFSF